MNRLKRIIFNQYDLEFHYSGDNPSRVVSVFEFINDDELHLLATSTRNNWDGYDDKIENQPQFYIHENDIVEIEPFDIHQDPSIISGYGKDTTNKGSS